MEGAAFAGAGPLAVETVPDLSFVRDVHVLRGHANTAMHVGVVLSYQGWDGVQISSGVSGREVAVQTRFQGAIETFGDGRFGVTRGGKMTNAFALQSALDGGVIEFFALVGLQGLGASSFVQNAFEGLDYLSARLAFQGTHPSVLGQDVYHRQQVTYPFVLAPEALHLHQIRHPLLIDVEH